MTLFIITLIIAVLFWTMDFDGHPAALTIIGWISTFGAGFWFLAHIFWVPFRRHEEQEAEKQKLESELQAAKTKWATFAVNWRPAPPYLIDKGVNRYCGRLGIHHTNKLFSAQNVIVKLESMDPAPSHTPPQLPIVLRRTDDDTRTINPDSTAYFELLTVELVPLGKQVVLEGADGSTQKFDEDLVNALTHGGYALEISISAQDSPLSKMKFKLSFPVDGHLPFTLSSINCA